MDPFDLRLWPGYEAAGGDLSQPAVIDQISIDSRRLTSAQSLFVALKGISVDGHQFVKHANAKFALVKKDWESDVDSNIQLLRVEDPLKSFQEIATVYREKLPCKIIAIAGSHGKTMVKDLLFTMLSTSKRAGMSPESFNSQIGVPLSLFTLNQSHEVAIIEAAFSQKGEMDQLAKMIQPDYAILTHLGKKHLATLGDKSTIAYEVTKLLSKPKEWVLLPKDPLLDTHQSFIQSEVHYWGESHAALPHASTLPSQYSLTIPYQIKFPDEFVYQGQVTSGFYYFMDLLNMTVKAATLLGVSRQGICDTLKHYAPEPMRTEIWKAPMGATFINDTYCSDPQSIDLSLRNYEQTTVNNRKIFLFGGLRENHADADYRRIGQAVNRAKIDKIYLYGSQPCEGLIQEVQKLSPKTEIKRVASYQNALDQYRSEMRPEDFVLIKGSKKEPLDLLTQNFHDSICTNQCIVNLAAIQTNIQAIRSKLPPKTRIMVIVKALAYGTNDIRMAKFLSTCGVDILGVSYVDEGVALKKAGVTQSIFVINAAYYEVSKVVKWNLEVGVSDRMFLEALAQEAEKQQKTIKVHLHIDTGMGRFGCRPEEAEGLAQFIRSSPYLTLEGLMTHFACADNPQDDAFTLSQARTFDEVVEKIPDVPWKHAANSSGTLRFQFDQYNMVRLGLAVYGLYASEATQKACELRLAISLVSRVVGINTCKAGESISYGRTYKVQKEEQKIAVLPIGYFDGLHRNYSGKGYVMIRGQKAPMVGKICMDFMMVDISDIPHASVGDPVLIFGEDEYGHYLSPEEFANRGDSIIHELITCLGPRIQRIFVHEESHHNATTR